MDIANDEKCADANCGHMASVHEDMDGGKNTGACQTDGCSCMAMKQAQPADDGDDGDEGDDKPVGKAPAKAPAPAPDPTAVQVPAGQASAPVRTFGAEPVHSTETVDTAWDGVAAKEALGTDPTQLAAAHAWFNSEGDSAAASDYSFVHHEVAEDGTVGAANVNACAAGIDALNAAVSGSDQPIPDADKQGVYDHLAAHITDAGKTPDAAKFTNGNIAFAAQVNKRFDASDPQAPPAALPAAPVDLPDGMEPFSMPIMILEGVDTGDGRYINPGALTWRDLPLVVMALTKTTFGHDEAELVARIDTIERIDASGITNPKTGAPYGNTPAGEPIQALAATGVFSSREYADEVAGLIAEGFLKGVSADLGDVKSELEFLDSDGNPLTDDEGNPVEIDEEEIWFLDFDDVREVITEGRVMGATICPFPAFEGAYIELGDGTKTPQVAEPTDDPKAKPTKAGASIIKHDRFGSRGCASCEEGQTLVASAGPMSPPHSWFEDPELSEPTPLTITEDGRIFGHLAVWSTCHTASNGHCITPPRSRTNYGYFRTGAVLVDDGDLVATGPITLNTGHAGLALDQKAAMAHYDDTGTAAADVAAGEDKFGIWVAGATRPDVTELDVRRLRASALSGDWRRVGTGLELVAALAVNAPGFPVVRAQTASGAMESLVAAGGRDVLLRARSASQKLQEVLAWKERMEPVLQDFQVQQLRSRVHPSA